MPKTSKPASHAPDQSTSALLVLDLISDFAFPEGKRLLKNTLPIVKRIAALKQRARARGIPTIYVNDNLGKWRSERSDLIQHCLSPDSLGRALVETIKPTENDYLVLKPKHSGFFDTPLQTLLEEIGTRTLIVTGITSHQCVLFTASDAYLRGYKLIIPQDCIAAMQPDQTRAALAIFRTALKANTSVSSRVRLTA